MFYWSIGPKKSKPLLLVQERVRSLNSRCQYDNIYRVFTIYRCSGGHLSTSFQLLLTKTLWGIIISRRLKLGNIKYLAKVTQWISRGGKTVSSVSSTSEHRPLTSMSHGTSSEMQNIQEFPSHVTWPVQFSVTTSGRNYSSHFINGKSGLEWLKDLDKIDHLLLMMERPVLALPATWLLTQWKMQLRFFWDKLILFLNSPCITAIGSTVIDMLKERHA